MSHEERKSTEKAAQIGFKFYMIALSASSIYSFFKNPGFNISFMILMTGIVVFFVSDFLLNKFKRP